MIKAILLDIIQIYTFTPPKGDGSAKDDFLSWKLAEKTITKGKKIKRSRQFEKVKSKISYGCTETYQNYKDPTKTIQVFVNIFSVRCIAIDVKSVDTIKNLKERIKEKVGISTSNQHIVYGRQKLED